MSDVCSRQGKRRLLIEGTVAARRMGNMDSFGAGALAGSMLTGVSLACCFYGYQPDPATTEYPLALISPASEKTVSSTLGELRERAGVLRMSPTDAAARGLSTDDPVRVFNALGEVHVPLAVDKELPPGTVALSKGLWRKSTYNGMTSNVLCPDSLTDLGGGACFNDARVQVTSLGKH